MASTALAHTFRDIDTSLGLAKGAAFRAFKSLLPELSEGIDFAVLDPRAEATTIRTLRAEGRLYPSSVRAVVLSARARALIERHLRRST